MSIFGGIHGNDLEANGLSPELLENVSLWYLEESRKIDPNILDLYMRNRKVDGFIYYLFIVLYLIIMFFGLFANILVVLVIARKSYMRTPRNMFILNLAVSDILLCLITMPLTLMEILTRYWPLGDNAVSCKIIGSSQALSIYVSTLSIVAIAVDRYHVIVHPTGAALKRFGATTILIGIWISSFILASPMYFVRKLEVHKNPALARIGLDSVAYCVEDWSITHGRAFHSIFVFVVQYAFPISVVTVSYARICTKLRQRYGMTDSPGRGRPAPRQQLRRERNRKTNLLLVTISLVYCVSWLPLDICNLVLDFSNPFGEDYHTTIIVYAICHMMGMSSACSNPFLYGWLNDNFRKEFKELLSILLCRKKPDLESGLLRPAWTRASRRRRGSNAQNEQIGLQVRSTNIPVLDNVTIVNETRFRDPPPPRPATEPSANASGVCHAVVERYWVENETGQTRTETV